jgi:hypothetical protein
MKYFLIAVFLSVTLPVYIPDRHENNIKNKYWSTVVRWWSGLYVWRGDPGYPETQITEGKLCDVDNIQKIITQR